MLKEKNKLFTIGQFADLHEINKKTLMWYDEIGLLKPALVKDNGYRCYSYEQSSTLETILMLRELNVSLKEIQGFINKPTIDSMEKLLEEKLQELEKTIAHLRSIRRVLLNHKEDMATLRGLDVSEIGLVEKQGSYLVTVAVSEEDSFEDVIEQVIDETKKYRLRRLHDASYGSMVSVENIYKGRVSMYDALYIEMPYPVSRKGLHLQPAGTYLRAFCRGSIDKFPQKYREMLAFAEEQGLELYGFSYEEEINELVAENVDDYITRIEIPVKKR